MWCLTKTQCNNSLTNSKGRKYKNISSVIKAIRKVMKTKALITYQNGVKYCFPPEAIESIHSSLGDYTYLGFFTSENDIYVLSKQP